MEGIEAKEGDGRVGTVGRVGRESDGKIGSAGVVSKEDEEEGQRAGDLCVERKVSSNWQ